MYVLKTSRGFSLHPFYPFRSFSQNRFRVSCKDSSLIVSQDSILKNSQDTVEILGETLINPYNYNLSENSERNHAAHFVSNLGRQFPHGTPNEITGEAISEMPERTLVWDSGEIPEKFFQIFSQNS